MNVLAINGSPRKNWNTATLLNKALEGAASLGARTELIHLYELNYKGCISCFECKRINGKSYGNCILKDDLTSVLSKVREADAIILGTPNYIGAPTGAMKSFMERLVFPYIVYEKDLSTLIKDKKPVGFIYTMGSSDAWMERMGFDKTAKFFENVFAVIFGASESLVVNDTYQFDDYAKYVTTRFDPVAKAKRRAEVFPRDCEKAFQMGIKLLKSLKA